VVTLPPAGWCPAGGNVAAVASGEAGPPAGRVSVYRHVVRYFECDQQGVVFNMWYLGYFDEALGAFLAGGGLGYRELVRSGVDVQLVHSEIDWSGPLRWGDEAVVEVRLAGRGTTSFAVGLAVYAGERPVATGRTVYVVVATDGSGKMALPDRLAVALGDVGAAGQPSSR
jgi:acyl-CoA thioester hydrolase